jgi:L-glutamine:2-deoxy-scyllo-inosose/3-amino-2,3-dideoxy-scyllo-inosose aminotransferase
MKTFMCDWPCWPVASSTTIQNTVACLTSGRWAISGPRGETVGREQIFADEFANFIGTRYCVPTTNGTSSLVAAFEALGIGSGDEVIIPGITWVASASSVLSVNALPVIVDIDPKTLCIDPAAIRAAIGSHTRAISIVHLYNSVCDLDEIISLCDTYGLSLVEDCAQAHGAAWRNQRVGGWGDIGTFSMQQTKLLTAGEGGTTVTNDASLYRRLYQLRADGRSRAVPAKSGEMELSLVGEIMGSNFCMSEITAAMLSSQLLELPDQNAYRARNAERLTELLADIPSVYPIEALPQVSERTHYYYSFRIDRAAFDGADASTVSAALRGLTGAPFQTIYPPLPQHPLLKPLTKPRFAAIQGIENLARTRVPEAERAYEEVVTLHHSALLAMPKQMELLAQALGYLQEHAHEFLREKSEFLVNPL